MPGRGEGVLPRGFAGAGGDSGGIGEPELQPVEPDIVAAGRDRGGDYLRCCPQIP